jgi:cation diffusion facilitator CzcD-associated flavoprotein CzcO
MAQHSQAAKGSGELRFDVLVMGAGFGGMYATCRIREMGTTVAGIEAGGDMSGVWYRNRYSGARCDLMSVDYGYGSPAEIKAPA